MKSKFLLLLFAMVAVPVMVMAQGGQGSSGASAQSAGGPSASTDVGKSANWDRLSSQGRSGDYLLGNVVVADGSMPWDPIAIIVTCDGKTRFTSATDPKGHFVIASEHTENFSPGSEDPKAKLTAQLMGCDVRAALAGFDSSTVKIVNRNLLDNPDIGTITLRREATSTGAAVSDTTHSAPKDAAKAFEKARGEWVEQKSDAAQHDLEKAVKAYPQFAEAWYHLGRIQELNKSPQAWDSFSRAAAADPKFIPPFEHLAALAGQSGKWDEAASNSAHVLELDPRGSPEIWYYNSLANYKLGKADAAEASASHAIAIDPLHTEPNAEQLLAVLLAAKGDYQGALQHLRNCLTYLPAGPNADTVKQQIAQLEKVAPGPH